MLDFIDLVVLALAVWQAVEIWHHSILFADWRSRSECWQGWFWGWLGDILVCPWCLSVWVAWWFLLFWLWPLPAVELSPGESFLERLWALTKLSSLGAWWALLVLFKGFIAGLAISRLANLGNDSFKAFCRTPKSDIPAETPANVKM